METPSLVDDLRELWRRTFQESYEANPIQRVILSAVGLTLVSSLLLLMLAATQWFANQTPVLLSLLLALPVGLIATLIATQDERPFAPLHYASLFVIGSLVSVSLGGVFGLSWKEDGVRNWFLEQAGRHDLSSVLMTAMKDENRDFANHACQQLVASRNEATRQLAYEGLKTRPELFTSCLNEYPDLSALWGKRLLDQWFARMYEADEEQVISTWSERLAMASEYVPGSTVALLSCALDREQGHATHKRMCIASMERHELVQDLLAMRLDQASTNAIYEIPMSTTLIEVIHDEAIEASTPLGFRQSEQLKRYALVTACSHMNLDNLSMSQSFYAYNQSRCQLGTVSLQQDTPFWESVCQQIILDEASNEQRSVEEMFCGQVRDRLVTRAVSEASSQLQSATINKHTRDRLLHSRLASEINKASRSADFAPTDSTGIVRDTEKYNRIYRAGERGLHNIGERRLKGKGMSAAEKKWRQENTVNSPKMSPEQIKAARDSMADFEKQFSQ